jgi:hypothetical protein
MTKRIAAAVLCAIVNFMGASDVSAGSVAADADDDGGTDYVELRNEHQATSTAQDPLLATASAVVGGEIDHAWILRHHSGPSAAVAVQRNALDHTATVSLSLDVPVLPWEELLHRSLKFCRDEDVLKVTIESQGLGFASIRPVAEASGFVFSRARRVEGVHVAEFYTDLYHRPRRPRSPEA